MRRTNSDWVIPGNPGQARSIFYFTLKAADLSLLTKCFYYEEAVEIRARSPDYFWCLRCNISENLHDWRNALSCWLRTVIWSRGSLQRLTRRTEVKGDLGWWIRTLLQLPLGVSWRRGGSSRWHEPRIFSHRCRRKRRRGRREHRRECNWMTCGRPLLLCGATAGAFAGVGQCAGFCCIFQSQLTSWVKRGEKAVERFLLFELVSIVIWGKREHLRGLTMLIEEPFIEFGVSNCPSFSV